MRALMLTGERTSVLRDVPVPEPADDEVLVRISMSAVCGSDLPHYRNAAGCLGDRLVTVPGHEAVGVVASPSSAGPPVGTRIIVYQHAGCGHCDYCVSGAPMFCAERRTLGNHRGGADAEYVTAPVSGLLPVPADVSDRLAALIACNFGTAYAGFTKTAAGVGDRVAVFGAGPVGCCVVALAAAAGAEVTAIDPVSGRRELADELGATTIDPRAADPVAELRGRTEGRGPEVVVECSANRGAQAQAMQVVRPRGSVLLLGANNSMEIDPGLHVIRKELRLLGSWVFTLPDYPAVLRAARALPGLGTLLGDPFSAAEAPEALAAADTGYAGKALISWS